MHGKINDRHCELVPSDEDPPPTSAASRRSGLAGRVAAAVPDLFPPEAIDAPALVETPAPVAALRPRTIVPPPLPQHAQAGSSTQALRISKLAPLPASTGPDTCAIPHVLLLTAPHPSTFSVAPVRGRWWITAASAALSSAATLILTVHLLPVGPTVVSPASASVEVPRAKIVESVPVPTAAATILPPAVDDERAAQTAGPAPEPSPARTSPPSVVRRADASRAAAHATTTVPEPAAKDPVEAPAEKAPALSEEKVTSFDREAAVRVLRDAAGKLHVCSLPEVGPGRTRVAVTFAPTGRATTALLEAPGPFAGTAVVGCIVSHLRTLEVPPFTGDNVTVHASVPIP